MKAMILPFIQEQNLIEKKSKTGFGRDYPRKPNIDGEEVFF